MNTDPPPPYSRSEQRMVKTFLGTVQLTFLPDEMLVLVSPEAESCFRCIYEYLYLNNVPYSNALKVFKNEENELWIELRITPDGDVDNGEYELIPIPRGYVPKFR